MAFKYGVFLIVVAHISTTFALPPCICTRNFKPVCGSDGKTYSNECILECEASKSKTDITVSKHAPCDLPVPDTCICTFNYLPVCGNDGQTYSNECTLNCQKANINRLLKVEHSGPCKTLPGPVSACPAIESPVCGSDGNTYGNECMLNGAASVTPGLIKTHDGSCVSRVKVQDI